jgi:hypothetical protein
MNKDKDKIRIEGGKLFSKTFIIERKDKIITHPNLDLDNAFSVVAYCLIHDIEISDKNIDFVPANKVKISDDQIAIDIKANKDKEEHSYFRRFRDFFPKELIQEIEKQDTSGCSDSVFPLQSILISLKKTLHNDLEILRYLKPIVKGLMEIKEERKNARKQLKDIPIVEINGYRFIVLQDKDISQEVGIYANRELNVTGTIYFNNNNMGIVRYPDRSQPDLSKLNLKGWFSHSKGFLFCWGSRKNPKKIPPPQFKNTDDFIKWLRKNLK